MNENDISKLVKNVITNADPDGTKRITKVATERALQDPVPGPSIEAFNDGMVDVTLANGKKVTIRPIVPADMITFKRINSPVYQLMLDSAMEPAMRGEIKFLEEDIFQFIYMFLKPASYSRQLACKDIEKYKEEAITEVGENMLPSDIALIQSVVIKQVFNANRTKVEFDVEKKKDNTEAVKEEEDDDFFSAKPPA